MNTYKNKLMKKADKKLKCCDLTQYEHLMVADYIESNFKNNKDGFIDYISNLFFNKHLIDLEEYQNLFDLTI